MSVESIKSEILALFNKFVEKPAYADHDEDSILTMLQDKTLDIAQFKKIQAWKQSSPVNDMEALLVQYEAACKPSTRTNQKKEDTPKDTQNKYACEQLGLKYTKVNASKAFGGFITSKKENGIAFRKDKTPVQFLEALVKLAGSKDALKKALNLEPITK